MVVVGGVVCSVDVGVIRSVVECVIVSIDVGVVVVVVVVAETNKNDWVEFIK